MAISRGHAARDHFREANACGDETTRVGAPGCVEYSGCEPSLPVEWCVHTEPTYQNTNHGWPSFASGEIARFFGTLGRVPHPAGTPLLSNESFDTGFQFAGAYAREVPLTLCIDEVSVTEAPSR